MAGLLDGMGEVHPRTNHADLAALFHSKLYNFSGDVFLFLREFTRILSIFDLPYLITL